MRIREYEIVQNAALGACALWHYARCFNKATNGLRGPSVPLCLPVLPITLHEESAKSLGRRRYEGGFHTALAEDRALFIGLQRRMEEMCDQTFSALNIALASGLLRYDSESHELFRIPRVRPPESNDPSIRLIYHTAERLGHWFSQLKSEEVLLHLHITF